MRLTVLHRDKVVAGTRATDVEALPGTTAEELRQAVARLTGRSEWASTRRALVADGVPLGPGHPVGLAPLLPGCTVSVGAGAQVPVERRAARSARHVAVVQGPDAGVLLPLPEGTTVDIGTDTELAVRDATWDRARLHVRIRTVTSRPWQRRGTPPRGPAVHVRAAGRGAPVRRARRRGRSSRLPHRRWVRWPLGAQLTIGRSVLELRDGTVRVCPAEPSAPDGVGEARGLPGAPLAHRPRDGQATTLAVSTVATVATAVVLALAVHQPLLALTGATGPLMWWAARRAGTPTRNLVQAPEVRAADVAALRLATALATPTPDLCIPAPWDVGGCLAVVGEREQALGVARATVVGELGSRGGCDVRVRAGDPEAWGWLVWSRKASHEPPVAAAEPGPGSDGGHRVLVVADGLTEPHDRHAIRELAHWRTRTNPSHRLLWIASRLGDVPAWCHNVLVVTGQATELREGGSPGTSRPTTGVRQDVAEAHAREIARATGRTDAGRAEPVSGGVRVEACRQDVALGSLPGVPAADRARIRAAWAAPGPGLRSPLGEGPDGEPVVIDLVRDGPHAAIAGTTGAGKSELLTTLVLGLTLAYPPDRLAVLLVDFKGGTGLPGLATLPHVVGRLSDLDAAGARRTLRGLGAELRRRERIVAAAGVRDVEDLPDPSGGARGLRMARLLVVIDEFRALADDLPELVPGLARIAAQGRSLGVHLVLATQRPAGAVPAELQANVSLRVALRVLDGADSIDLVGVPDAARISSATPGRAVLVRGGGAAEAIQVARAGTSPPRTSVQLAPPPTAVLAAARAAAWTPRRLEAATEGDAAVAGWVRAARAAARALPTSDVPWLPELPRRVTTDDVPAVGSGLALALADLPEEQRRAGVGWDPTGAHLLVLGGPRSGRSTTLLTVGRQALRSGRHVHAIGLPPPAVDALRTAAPERLGTVVPADDLVTTARLLHALQGEPPGGGAPVLLVDGLDVVLDRLGTLARGAAADLLTSLWGRSDPPVHLAVSAPVSPLSSRLLGYFADRLVLGVADPALDAVAGVPATFTGARTVPGRAVHLRAGHAVLCQVALPGVVPPPQLEGGPSGAATTVAPRRLGPPPDRAPHSVPPAWLSGDGRLHVPVGLGADGGGPVVADVTDALVVVGPPGSGRTNALHAVASAVEQLGLPTFRPGGPTPEVGHELGDVLSGARDDVVVLVDDLDDLERADPHLLELLVDRLNAQRRRPVAGHRIRVVATTTTAYAAASYRGLVPVLLRARRVLALDVREPGSTDLLGADARWLADPRGGPAGRAALRRDRTVVPLQVWAPADDRSAAGAGTP